MNVDVDVKEMQSFFAKFEKAGSGEFKTECADWMQAIGEKFLELVQNEIIARDVVDSRLLLNSFHKGGDGNMWTASEGGLVLEVGTNVEYAQWVEEGHSTCPPGVARRWVPGSWNGGKFEYSPGAKTGMLLKAHWVEGTHYFEAATRLIGSVLPKIAAEKINQWMAKYFGG